MGYGYEGSGDVPHIRPNTAWSVKHTSFETSLNFNKQESVN